MDIARDAAAFFLLAFPALFAIVNPIGGAFIFFSATHRLASATRALLARWVAIHSFVLLAVSLYVGAYVLSFFGISMPVLRVGGGIVIATAAWRILNAADDDIPERITEIAAPADGDATDVMTQISRER